MIPHDQLLKCVERRISDRSVLKLIRMWLASPIAKSDEAGPAKLARSKQGTPQGGEITPPTKVQNFFFACGASFPRKKGEVNPIDDADLMGLDHDALDERTEDLATRGPIGLVQVVVNRLGEAVQALKGFAQHGLLARPGL